jgi:hypothetical protein
MLATLSAIGKQVADQSGLAADEAVMSQFARHNPGLMRPAPSGSFVQAIAVPTSANWAGHHENAELQGTADEARLAFSNSDLFADVAFVSNKCTWIEAIDRQLATNLPLSLNGPSEYARRHRVRPKEALAHHLRPFGLLDKNKMKWEFALNADTMGVMYERLHQKFMDVLRKEAAPKTATISTKAHGHGLRNYVTLV